MIFRSIYIIENNKYSMGTSQDARPSSINAWPNAARPLASTGNRRTARTSIEVRAVTQTALERAHNESRPTLIEFDTYRYYGHSVADAKHKGGYRNEEEIEKYKNEHDPIRSSRSA